MHKNNIKIFKKQYEVRINPTTTLSHSAEKDLHWDFTNPQNKTVECKYAERKDFRRKVHLLQKSRKNKNGTT